MRAGSRAGWSVLRDAVRTQLWPIPAVGIALAALAGILLPRLDARIDDNLPPTITDYLFGLADAWYWPVAVALTLLSLWFGRPLVRHVRGVSSGP